MNRRGFFGALVGGIAALATGSLIPKDDGIRIYRRNSHPLTFTNDEAARIVINRQGNSANRTATGVKLLDKVEQEANDNPRPE